MANKHKEGWEMEDRLWEMDRRLARAERHARMNGALACLSLVAALVLCVVKPGVTENEATTVKAPFRVVNREGKVLVQISEDKVGQTRFALLYKADAEQSFTVIAGDNGGLVGLMSDEKEDTPKLLLTAKPEGSLLMLGGSKEVIATLGASPAKVTLFLDDGKKTSSAP